MSIESSDIEILVSNVAIPEGPPSGASGFEPSGEVDQHSGRVKDLIEKADPAEFLESWHKAVKAVAAVFRQDESDDASGFELETITARLSLSASGKVAFVGELGGEVAFEATFKRRS